ncbi:MAG: hypothetical protein EHM28_14755 [Spirochaetaceae bacterium]|nr:MAG: hypothetical protein EHM28_14755 [Spirochaetaceae bacterium]
MKMITLSVVFALATSPIALAQAQAVPNIRQGELLVFSFKIANSTKHVTIVDTANSIIYRYGTPGKVELEFPKNPDNLKKYFTFTWYSRPDMGGTNAGLDEYTLSFENNGYRYEIQYSHYYPDNATSVGIRISDPAGKQIADLAGDSKTISGSLLSLRDDERLIQRPWYEL